MPPLDLARTVLLVMAVLALLTATVLDGVMMRYFVHPMLRLGERKGGEAARPPRPLAFMFERAWARRLYHLLFAALLFAGWWYLGTPTGAARWAQLAQTSPSSDVRADGGWRVLDSTWVAPWDEMTDSVAVYRLAVATRAGADTLREILAPWPVVVGDSVVWGLQRLPGTSERVLFRWSAPGRTPQRWPLPTDALGNFTDMMVSPDGRYLAYVGISDAGRLYGAVRALPEGRELWRSSVVAGCECDVDLSHARWVSADSFEIAVVSTSDQRGWAIFRGSAASRRAAVEFVAAEPEWHAGQRGDPR